MRSDGRAVPTVPNQAVPLRSDQAKGRGNMSSCAMARDVSVTMRVQPLRAPMPDITAMAAMNFPAQAFVGKHRLEGIHERRPVPTSVWCETRPMTAGSHQHVEQGTGRSADHRGARSRCDEGLLTRLAVIAAASTPMKEKSATPAAIPMPL